MHFLETNLFGDVKTLCVVSACCIAACTPELNPKWVPSLPCTVEGWDSLHSQQMLDLGVCPSQISSLLPISRISVRFIHCDPASTPMSSRLSWMFSTSIWASPCLLHDASSHFHHSLLYCYCNGRDTEAPRRVKFSSSLSLFLFGVKISSRNICFSNTSQLRFFPGN
jgi:hypothetical protein